jgi:hypothetical protein
MAKRGRRMQTLPPLPSLIDLPPTAQLESGKAFRAEWRDPTDTTPNALRTARMVTGYRRQDPLRRCLKRHGSSCGITERMILAADRLRVLADAITVGFSGRREWLVYWDRDFGPVTGPPRSATRGARAWPAFRRAMNLYNASERELVTGVVLLNRSASSFAKIKREEGVSADDRWMMRTLVTCLERLEEHFASEVDEDLARGMAA